MVKIASETLKLFYSLYAKKTVEDIIDISNTLTEICSDKQTILQIALLLLGVYAFIFRNPVKKAISVIRSGEFMLGFFKICLEEHKEWSLEKEKKIEETENNKE